MASEFTWSSFIELPGFEARWRELACTDADLRALQLQLLENPCQWPVVPKAGGWRKARFAPPSWGVGKSGAVRVYYAEVPKGGLILLGTAFAKSQTSDLRLRDKRILAALLKQYHQLFEDPTR
jgi:hypothetical protein